MNKRKTTFLVLIFLPDVRITRGVAFVLLRDISLLRKPEVKLDRILFRRQQKNRMTDYINQ